MGRSCCMSWFIMMNWMQGPGLLQRWTGDQILGWVEVLRWWKQHWPASQPAIGVWSGWQSYCLEQGPECQQFAKQGGKSRSCIRSSAVQTCGSYMSQVCALCHQHGYIR